MNKKKCLVFDLDGTLIDSTVDLGNAVNVMRKEFNLPPLDLEQIKSFVGNGVTALVKRSLFDAPELEFEPCYKSMTTFYRAHSTDNTKTYPGVVEGMKKLKENGMILVVLTNKMTDAAIDILQVLGVSPYLDEIIGSTSNFPRKPAPDAILYLMDKYKISKEYTYMLGDHYTDLEAGRRANCNRIFAEYGIGQTMNEEFDFEVNSFSDFVDKILNL